MKGVRPQRILCQLSNRQAGLPKAHDVHDPGKLCQRGCTFTFSLDTPMGICIRHLLVDENDEVLRLSNRLFERLWDKLPGGVLPQFAGRRVRWAEAAVQMENYRPVAMVRVIYSYMYFDRRGHLDRDRLMQDAVLKMEAGMGNIFPRTSGTVINASSRFAARRRDHEAVWAPSPKIESATYDAAFGSKRFRRL